MGGRKGRSERLLDLDQLAAMTERGMPRRGDGINWSSQPWAVFETHEQTNNRLTGELQ